MSTSANLTGITVSDEEQYNNIPHSDSVLNFVDADSYINSILNGPNGLLASDNTWTGKNTFNNIDGIKIKYPSMAWGDDVPDSFSGTLFVDKDDGEIAEIYLVKDYNHPSGRKLNFWVQDGAAVDSASMSLEIDNSIAKLSLYTTISNDDDSDAVPTTAWVNSRITDVMNSKSFTPNWDLKQNISPNFIAPSDGAVIVVQNWLKGEAHTQIITELDNHSPYFIVSNNNSSAGQQSAGFALVRKGDKVVTSASTWASAAFAPIGS